MKKKAVLLTIAIGMLLPCSMLAGNSINGVKQIVMGVRPDNPPDEMDPIKRSPTAPIYVMQEDHRFVFDASFAGETIQIFNGDSLLYTDVIGVDGSVSVPDGITGEVELCLVRGCLTYHVMVEL